jgi:ribosomal protein S18 acetylase RimI-like enzyme
MPLPEPIRSFFYAYESLAARVVRTPWGLVVTDRRYPDVYDANKAQVLEAAPGLTFEDMRRVLVPMLERDGIDFEHVEFMCMADRMAAVGEAQAACGRSRPDAVMAIDAVDATPAPRPSQAEVREVTDPDQGFWKIWIDSRLDFGTPMPQPVLDQLLDRDRSVFRPAGMRIFAGYLDGELAGFCSLLSMEAAGYIDSVVTRREHRRKGVASATVMAAAAASRRARDRATFLLAEYGGRPQRLYEGLGFSVIARANGFTRPREPLADTAGAVTYL